MQSEVKKERRDAVDTKYLKNVLKYILSAVLCLVLIAYIIYHLTGGLRSDIGTTPASYVTVESTYTTGVTLLRSETVLYSPVQGEISYLHNDGEKVAVNTDIAEVYPYSGSTETRQRIMEINRTIRLLENSNMSDAEKRTDTTSTDAKIKNNIYKLLDAMDKGNVSYADILSDDLLIQLNRRRIITKSVNNFNKQIAELNAEKRALSASLPQSERTVKTTDVGYFYTSLDGYENIFSADNISSLTYGEYLALVSAPAEDLSATDNGYPVGKIVTDYLWYVACEIDISELHNYETGRKYNVKFPYNNDTSISMSLYRILSEAGSDTAVLVFETGMLPSNFNYLRHQTVQIVKEVYTGCRVPVSAVRVVNGNSGVYVLQGSKVVFKRISPLYEYDGYIISEEKKSDGSISWLSKNDFIVVKGKNLYDGKIVE